MLRTIRQTNRLTRKSYPRRPTESAWVVGLIQELVRRTESVVTVDRMRSCDVLITRVNGYNRTWINNYLPPAAASATAHNSGAKGATFTSGNCTSAHQCRNTMQAYSNRRRTCWTIDWEFATIVVLTRT